MSRLRPGWTLHEMIISLAVTSAVVGLAVHAAVAQLRFFRGMGEVATVRGRLAQTTGVARAVLWSASPGAGDIVVAQDTALEMRTPIGTAVVCEGTVARIVVPAPVTVTGNTLSAFVRPPQPDDAVAALLDDSISATWLALRVAAAPVPGGPCPRFPDVTVTWSIDLVEPLIVPAGAVLRFTRPIRLSLYRASDGRWYLGAKEWNPRTLLFNSIQPVAGPLDPAGATPANSGLYFEYLGADGLPLAAGADPRTVAGVRVVARGTSIRPVRAGGVATTAAELFADSSAAQFTFRNGR